jgi:serine/threonine protein kinase
MTPERWSRVSELFEAALEKDEQVRSAFLAEACAGDGELRAEVESLLGEHACAGDFLNGPPSAAAASALREALQDGSVPAEHDPYLGMTLGTRYSIEERLARGGQALIYRARDTVVLSRPVVVKILHPAREHSGWLREKFQQEMEALSRIDHPGIVGVLDTGELPDGRPFLVIQYVEGVTLRQALENGPLDPIRVAAILRQIGAALEAAHALGIAHRDLKPENIMLQRTSDGSELVRLIDFGIAKVEKPEPGLDTTCVMVAGTIRYMAPEQFQGENSRASDIYTLGLIACEMLCGRPDAHTLETPWKVREQIHAALAYRPQDRPQKASEFCNQVAEILIEKPEKTPPRVVILRRGRLAGLIAALLVAVVGTIVLLRLRERSPGASAVDLSLVPPEGTSVGSIAVSPDGRRIAFVATDAAGQTRLWVRSLNSLTAQPLVGTEGASSPFWSADNRFLAFFAAGKLMKIEASGGPAQAICSAETVSQGGAWNRDGVILFTPNPTTPLYRVSATGGEPTPVTALDQSRAESSHGWPQFLPDGHHFLFFAQSAQPGNSGIYAAALDSAQRRRLVAAGSSALYAAGHLLFVREHTLMAQPLDTGSLQLRSEAFPIAEHVGVSVASSQSLFSVSEDAVLAYDSSGPRGYTQLVWFDRTGRELGTVVPGSGPRTIYSNVEIEAQGTRIAVDRRDPQTATRDIWLFDPARGSESRLTFDPATDASPVWSPDGSRVIFFSARDGVWNLYSKVATGAGKDEVLLKSNGSKIPCDWSLDGRYILYLEWDPKTKWDLWVLPTEGDRKPVPIVRTPFDESHGQFSPDGRWLAYSSYESGREEVYVEPFTPGSPTTGKWQISTNGGTVPRWRRDGKELFYMTLDRKLMAVEVADGATFRAGASRPLFQTRAAGFMRYDVTADGQRFLVNTAIEEHTSSFPTVVLNWTAGLKR